MICGAKEEKFIKKTKQNINIFKNTLDPRRREGQRLPKRVAPAFMAGSQPPFTSWMI